MDDLLSGDTVLAIAEEDRTQSEKRSRTLVFGLLDCSAGLLLFLPFFGIRSNKTAQAVSLLSLVPAVPYIKPLFLAAVISLTLCGIVTLALQNAELPVWQRSKEKVSLCLSMVVVFLFRGWVTAVCRGFCPCAACHQSAAAHKMAVTRFVSPM